MAARKRIDESRQPLLLPGLRTTKEALRSLRNYLAGQFVGATRDDVLLDEVLKCLFCKLYMELGQAPVPTRTRNEFELAQHVRTVFARVREGFPDIYQQRDEILLDPPAIAKVLDECVFPLLDAAHDLIGDAFEVFVGAESRGRAGQFFTPRPVTDFLVDAVSPAPGETIIDPACGAGGFLASVARYFRAAGHTAGDLGKTVSQTFYGIDKDEYLTKLARLHISLLTDGHPHVLCADSIAMRNGSVSVWDRLPRTGFDVLLTNPPFGVKIVAANPEVLRGFDLARRWWPNTKTHRLEPTTEVLSSVPPQVLFVERCVSLLRPGGRLGMVLPESILSNKSYRHVIEYLLDHLHVLAVIGMPEALFKTSGKGGTHTKTCLLVARKKGGSTSHPARIFMAEAKWCGHDSRARSIPNNDLPTIAKNLSEFRRHGAILPSTLGFAVEPESVASNVLCPRYYDPQVDADLAVFSQTHDLVTFGDLLQSSALSLTTGDELGKLAYGTGAIPFIRTSDLSNWEIKADPKHAVDRRYYESLRHKQDVRDNDILMVKDGTYLIGTCAIVSRLDAEIIFQSHLYKIRVNRNERGLDPFLLLAILSSAPVQRQIRAKQFTQDIIDSLGDRIRELVLPIPRDPDLRARISEMVQGALGHRIEARELAQEARVAVVSGAA